MEWIILPFVDAWDLTKAALQDCLAQTLPDVHVLLIDQGSNGETRRQYTRVIEQYPRASLWRHIPPLLSLGTTWNTALEMVWQAGEDHALVVNNDIRMWAGTYEYLYEVQRRTEAYFVTATGVTREQYDAYLRMPELGPPSIPGYPLPGPDFSCYLITKAGHQKYPFDTHYIPAYCEDIDLHRRYMLGGDGAKMFGTGLPYHHIGSGTLKSMSPEEEQKHQARIQTGSRAYHLQKWGGHANQEIYTTPFGPYGVSGVSTPELFERVRNGHPPL